MTARAELGVKAYADPEVLAGQEKSAEKGAGDKMSGTAYLRRRRRALAANDEAFRVAAEYAERIHARLLSQAVDGKRKPASDRTLSDRKDWTVLNGTYLVNDKDVDDFRAVVAAVDRDTPGIELEVTGPCCRGRASARRSPP